jgi:hypothetical protein
VIVGLDELGQQCRTVRQAMFMFEGHVAGGVLGNGSTRESRPVGQTI